MAVEFFALSGQTPGVLEKLEQHSPENPFCTVGYVQSIQEMGSEPWVVGLSEDGRWRTASVVFLKKGRLNRSAEFTSLPSAAGSAEYWLDFFRFCAEHDITQIQADTYASPAVEVPPLKGETSRKRREEHVMDLTVDALEKKMSKKHLQPFRKARDSGMTIWRGRDLDACREPLREHLRTIEASLGRRRGRGEAIESQEHERSCTVFLKRGCGELFQALSGKTVLASALVLRAAKGAYYQSAGTTLEGMSLGASNFLIHNIALILKDEGVHAFNLGGAPAGSSLAKFKGRFGASIVSTSAVSLYIGPVWRRKLTNLMKLSQENPNGLPAALLGNTLRLKVYAAETSHVTAPAELPGTEIVSLDAEELKSLKVEDEEFRRRQLERLDRFGRSYAYGVFVEGKLAHVSWLLPSAVLGMDHPWVLKLPANQAEISCCETLPEYRGRGLYPFAIKKLCVMARQQGIHRIYMKTSVDNKASQSGILKAGLTDVGSAVLLGSPLLGSQTRVLRLFR